MKLTSDCDADADDGHKRMKPSAAAAQSEPEFTLRSHYPPGPDFTATGAVRYGQLSAPEFDRSQVNRLPDFNTPGYQNSGWSSVTGGNRYQECGSEFGADYVSQRYELRS